MAYANTRNVIDAHAHLLSAEDHTKRYHLPYVENGSYMLSVREALQKYFGYHKILKEAHIETMLEQSVEGNPEEQEFTNLTMLGFPEKIYRLTN